MWASSLSDIVVGITILLVPLDMYDRNNWLASAAVSLGWALQHLVTEGVAFLLMQYGCGMEAAKRSFFYATLWVSPSHLCRYCMQSLPSPRYFILTHPLPRRAWPPSCATWASCAAETAYGAQLSSWHGL